MIIGILFSVLIVNGDRNYANKAAVDIFNSLCQGCTIEYYGEDKGYGIKATKNILYGDIMFSLPFQYMITSFDYYPWSSYFENTDHTFKLVPRLIYEKYINPVQSPMKTMINFIPENFRGLFNLTAEERNYYNTLFGESTKLNFPINCTESKIFYKKKVVKIPNIDKCPECLDEKVFMWACQAVLTRAYSFSKDKYYRLAFHKGLGNEKNVVGAVMLPGIDIFNHSPRPKSHAVAIGGHGIQYLDNPSQAVAKADRNMNMGDELYMSYGSKTNIELSILHGFIIENNDDDIHYAVVISDINDCKNYNSIQKFCPFTITKSAISYEIINYLYYRTIKEHKQINDIFLEFDMAQDFERVILLKTVMQNYRATIINYGLDKCRKNFRDVAKIIREGSSKGYYEKLFNNLCYTNHLGFYSHLKHADRVLLKGLHSKVFS
ncbi:hypothetical protein SteCoe_16387 [Stentor coeruleus]|uniref:SET domain-containing protein n=1 Tax=Stentor coeruleus TaxID=5963 RepID=A0A1R2C192_9CILI|nr:hypothetical protein SteCoe_16387 [Stentor coeruleus]